MITQLGRPERQNPGKLVAISGCQRRKFWQLQTRACCSAGSPLHGPAASLQRVFLRVLWRSGTIRELWRIVNCMKQAGNLNFSSPLSLEWPNPALCSSLFTSATCNGNCTEDIQAFTLHLLVTGGFTELKLRVSLKPMTQPYSPLNAQKLSFSKEPGRPREVLEKLVMSAVCFLAAGRSPKTFQVLMRPSSTSI